MSNSILQLSSIEDMLKLNARECRVINCHTEIFKSFDIRCIPLFARPQSVESEKYDSVISCIPTYINKSGDTVGATKVGVNSMHIFHVCAAPFVCLNQTYERGRAHVKICIDLSVIRHWKSHVSLATFSTH